MRPTSNYKGRLCKTIVGRCEVYSLDRAFACLNKIFMLKSFKSALLSGGVASLITSGLIGGVSQANASDFILDWNSPSIDWAYQSWIATTYEVFDPYGFKLDVRVDLNENGNGDTVNGYPEDQTTDGSSIFGTSKSLWVVHEANIFDANIGEDPVEAELRIFNQGALYPTTGISFDIYDVDSTDNNSSSDRCDFITATGNNGNPTLSYGTATTPRSVFIGPGSGSGSTGFIAANQAQCIYNTGSGGSTTSNGDHLGTVHVDFPVGTSVAQIHYDESIGDVYGSTLRSADPRGIGVFANTIISATTNTISLNRTASSATYLSAGEVITYNYTITNNGPLVINTGQNIHINDDKIGTFTCGTVSADIGVGATHTCNNTYTVSASDVTNGTFTSIATAGVGTGSQSFATRLQSNSDSETATLSALDLAISSSVDLANARIGENVTFTVSATNNGPATATNVTLNDLMPSDLVLVSSSISNGSYDSGSGHWNIGSIANGTTETLTLVGYPKSGTIGQTVTNTAGSVTLDQTDTNATLDDYSASTNVISGSALTCSGQSNSGLASSGTGAHLAEVFWLDWDCGVNDTHWPGGTITKSWTLDNGAIVTALVSNITSPIKKQFTTSWAPSNLDDLYAGVNPIGLANYISAADPSFDVAFSATLNGVNVSLDYIVADAEWTDAGLEDINLTTTGSSFSLIETFGPHVVSGVGTNSVIFTSPSNGGTSLVETSGSPTIGVDFTVVGVQAISFGIRMKRDFSDAPLSATSYASASHYTNSTFRLGSVDATNESADYDHASAAGDVDEGITMPSIVQGETVTYSANVLGTNGYLHAWSDWDANGAFGAGEQIATAIQDGGAGDVDGTANGVIQFVTTVPPSASTSQSFARFRWSTNNNTGSSGLDTMGEVEDYTFSIAQGVAMGELRKTATLVDGNSNGRVDAGEVITYVFEFENTGNVTLTALSLSDAGATIIDGLGGGTDAIAPGASNSVRFTGTHSVTQSEIDAGLFSNQATLSATPSIGGSISDLSDDPTNAANVDDGSESDGEPDDPTVVSFTQIPSMSVNKTSSVSSDASAGDIITYSYEVTNTGNVTLTNISMNDVHNGLGVAPVPNSENLTTDNGVLGNSSDASNDGVWDSLAPLDVITFSANYTVTQADVDALQ